MKNVCQRAVVMAFLLGAAACFGGPPETAEEERTRREKDSIIATLPIPGAAGVGRALDAVDASEARKLAHDTIS